MFVAIDQNQDGFLSREEMEAISSGVLEDEFKSMMGRQVNWREIFSILDQNNDGLISYAEFLAGATDKASLLNEEHLRMAFDTMDLNGDGQVTIDEMKWRFGSTNFQGSC